MDKPKLFDQVRTTAALRHLSPRTCEAYTHWMKRFILFNNKNHPLQMGAPEVGLCHLAQGLEVSASTQNQTLNVIAFLYHQVLGHKWGALEISPPAKRPKQPPVVFSPAEVQNVLGNLTGTDHLMACLLYGSGLRITECTSLRVKDLDFDRHLILVRRGKGEKDRVTMLPR